MQQAGLLLVNRKRIALANGTPDANHIDTGLMQTPLGVKPDPPVSGTALVASRVMVVPLAPLAKWATITHGEPHLGSGAANEPHTDHVYVTFTNSDAPVADLNVLFWDPDTKIGPLSANTYNAPT